MNNKRLTFFHALCITAIAFALNYLWEIAQCSRFFVHGDGGATRFAMLSATLGDVFMTWVVQVVLAIMTRRWLWLLDKWRWQQWAVFLGMALTMSLLVESVALAALRWSYTDINPRIPGTSISILPVFQLGVLLPATFGLSRRFLRNKSRGSCCLR
jgi:hypothetical protein